GATGLRGVPIQVWTTKSFTASWETPFDPGKPLVQADVSCPEKKPHLLTGTITSRLPVVLEDVYLFRNSGEGGRWYALDQLQPNDARRVDAVINGPGIDTPNWIRKDIAVAPRPNQAPRRGGASNPDPLPRLMKRVMFLEGEQSNQGRNVSSVRALGQRWRPRHQGELGLVGRGGRPEGLGEGVRRAH